MESMHNRPSTERMGPLKKINIVMRCLLSSLRRPISPSKHSIVTLISLNGSPVKQLTFWTELLTLCMAGSFSMGDSCQAGEKLGNVLLI